MIFHMLITIISTTGAPDWVPNCCMVLHEQMFMQGACVQRNKTSGLTALILYLALENETEEYNSRREKNPVINKKKY